jgi:hypothetical protein
MPTLNPLAIQINSGLRVLDNTPVDERISVPDIATLIGFASNNIYEGMIVYVQSVDTVYGLTNTSAANIAPGVGSGWKPLAQISGGVTQVNNNLPIDNNIAITLLETRTGLSASAAQNVGTLGTNWNLLPQMSSSFPFYKLSDGSTPATAPSTGSVWVVAGETIAARTGSNGKVYIFASSSQFAGSWIEAQAFSNSVITSYLSNYFDTTTVPLSDSASAVKVNSEDSSTAYPVTFINPTSMDYYSTLKGNTDFTYTPSTNLLNATSSWAKNANTASAIQTSNNTIINGNNIVYVNNEGDLVTNIEGNVTNVDSSIKYFTDTATVVADTPAAGTLSGSLKELQIIDYDSNVSTVWNAVTGRLTIYFGTPQAPSSLLLTTNNSGESESWESNRFNGQLDAYDLRATWSNGSYTLLTASIWQEQTNGSYTKLGETTSNVTLLNITTQNDTVLSTNGSSYPNSTLGSPVGVQRFRLHVTASNPVDNTISRQSYNLTKTLNKTLPGNPTQTAAYSSSNSITSYLTTGYSRTIEYGDTGTISHGGTVGSANSWNPVGGVGNNITLKPDSPVGTVTVNTTSGYTLQCTASYNTNGSNTPEIVYEAKDTNIVYTRQRSVRIGVVEMSNTYAATSSITSGVLTDVGNWTNTYMEAGTIYSTLSPTPNGKTVTVTFNYSDANEGRRLYIIVDSSYTLTAVNTAGTTTNNLSSFTSITVGGWKIYYSTATLGLGTSNPNTNVLSYDLVGA